MAKRISKNDTQAVGSVGLCALLKSLDRPELLHRAASVENDGPGSSIVFRDQLKVVL